MTEEEKKAIVYWKERLKDYKKEIVERQNDEFKGYGTLEDIAKLNYCTLHTLLNLIQKQQKINGNLREKIKEIEDKNRAIKNESDAYAQRMINLYNELQCEKEHSKYEWIRQNCLPQGLVNKLYIPKSKIKEKIEEINSRIEKYREYAEQGIETDVEWVDNVADRETIQVLQELLEE